MGEAEALADSRPDTGKSRDRVLGVERSLLGRRWESRLDDPRQALALAQQLDQPEILGRILAARGILSEDVDDFLEPRLRNSLPDPLGFKDMEAAVARVLAALDKDQNLAVFGDYDVDGATSSALLKRFFAALGRHLVVYIPDRLAEGYGPNLPALLRLREQGIKVLFTVDCGISSFEALAGAAEAGLDVIVIDHHAAEPALPEAAAVINPNRLDESGQCRQLAAVGVTFLFLVALNRALRQAGWYDRKGLSEPDLRQLLDLVALGTVCDVVPLTGLNRAFVAQGLKVMAQRGNIGLSALSDVARIDRPPGTYHAGFLLGPRINAGGRVGEAGLGARLLTTADRAEAADIAARLDAFNQERKEIEQFVLDQALAQAQSGGVGDRALVVVAGEGWHPGVVGIVASRLTERFGRPSLVIALEHGVGKGSGRSVPGVDLGREILVARQSGLLINGGGHKMAAGLTVSESGLAELRDFLEERIGRQMAAADYRPTLGIDGALQPRAANRDLVAQVERIAPFGVGNPEPRFVLPAVQIQRPRVVGGDHLSCSLTGADGTRLKAIAFRAFDGAMGSALLEVGGLPHHIAGKLRVDHWVGPEAVQFIIDDAAPSRE